MQWSAKSPWSWAVAAALSLVAGAAVLFAQGHTPGTSTTSSTEELQSIGAQVLYFEAPEIVKRGSARVVVVRFTRPVEFVPHHFRTEKLPGPQIIDAWADHLNAP